MDKTQLLFQACKVGHLADAKRALGVFPSIFGKADIEAKNEDGDTPLLVASWHPSRNGTTPTGAWLDDEVRMLLIRKGANVNARGKGGRTVLGGLCDRGTNGKMLARVFAAGAEVNAKDKMGDTALHHCVYGAYGRSYEVTQLIAQKADVNITNINGYSALARLVEQCEDASSAIKIAKALIAAGARVNPSGVMEVAPLCAAAKAFIVNVELIDFLIQSGADVNWRSLAGDTALIVAAKHGPSSYEYLFEGKSSLFCQLYRGRREEGQPKLLEALLRHGANPNLADASGNTALMWAHRNASQQCVDILMAHGADPNCRNQRGLDIKAFVAEGNAATSGMQNPLETVPQSEHENLPDDPADLCLLAVEKPELSARIQNELLSMTNGKQRIASMINLGITLANEQRFVEAVGWVAAACAEGAAVEHELVEFASKCVPNLDDAKDAAMQRTRNIDGLLALWGPMRSRAIAEQAKAMGMLT